MSRKDKYFMILQTLFAIFGVLVGYPQLGNIFIIFSAPFVLYMVFRKKAIFLPPLILHCVSETSIIFLVSFSIIIISVANYEILSRNTNIRILFWGLIAIFPIFIYLICKKILFGGFQWQQALVYAGYYLSFWSFIYGYIISGTFTWKETKFLIYIILSLLIMSMLFPSIKTSRIYSMMLYMGVPYGLYMLHKTSKKILGLGVIILSLLMLFGDRNLTFTELLTIFISIIVSILWFREMRKTAKNIISLPAYIVIVIIMITSTNNYSNGYLGEYSDYKESGTLENIYGRVLFKLYDDRAVFWSAAWEQIKSIKPLMPKYDMPDLIAYSTANNELDASSFGAHNTPLQLIRIFGIIMGAILIIFYIYMTILSSKILLCINVDKRLLPLFITIISYVVVIFLTGTAAMLPQFCLFYFGIMGISYGKSLTN